MSRRRAGRVRRTRYAEKEDINPMNFVSNLSDVMLILAVGIMLALVLHWNVPLETKQESEADSKADSISFDENDLESMEELPENIEKMGDVFYDASTGKYYIVEQGSNGE